MSDTSCARKAAKRAVPIALGALGVWAVLALVADVGADQVGDALARAWPWIAVLVAFEVSTAAAEATAVRALLGERGAEISIGGWMRSSALAVACAQLLPGGRVLGEVARATALSRWIDGARALVLVLRVHGTYLLTISLSSFLCLAAVSTGDAPSPLLTGLLTWSAFFNLGLGVLFLAGPRHARLGRWLGRRIGVLAVFGPRFDDAVAATPALDRSALARLVAARAIHAAGSAAAVFAIAGSASLDTTVILGSEAIQLVAANAGDAVPGQVGVLEGGYRLFASAVGMAENLGLALSVALLVRLSRLVLALGAAAIATLCREHPSTRAAATAAVALAVSVWPASPATAQIPPTKVVVRQRVVGVLEPAGAEHAIAIGMHVPLGGGSSPLFADTHLELGAINYTSPVYSTTGAYLQMSPLAFLVLRAEVAGTAHWSIGMDGAGFFPVQGYEADVRSQSLPAGTGRVASGLNAQMSAILQGAVSFGRLRPILWNQLVAEYERLGEEDFHYSPKYDLVLARSDWMIANTAMALLELALGEALALRVGAYDDLRYVLGSGALTHQLGATAMFAVTGGGCLHELLIFARAGAFLAPERRADQATGLIGLIARYDL